MAFWTLGLSRLLWHIMIFSLCSMVQKCRFLPLESRPWQKVPFSFRWCCIKHKISEVFIISDGPKRKKDGRRCQLCNLIIYLPTASLLWDRNIPKSDQLYISMDSRTVKLFLVEVFFVFKSTHIFTCDSCVSRFLDILKTIHQVLGGMSNHFHKMSFRTWELRGLPLHCAVWDPWLTALIAHPQW